MEGTYKTELNNAVKLLQKSDDYNAWAEVIWAGTIIHNNLLNTGQTDWASHMIEHEISGIYDIVLGAGLSTVFPAGCNMFVSIMSVVLPNLP